MFDLTGLSALVTGASGGIGGAIATALHGAGAHVVLSGTREGALQAVAERLGSRAAVVVADLGTPEGAEQLASAAEAAAVAGGGQGVDILVNNAGLTRDQLALRMKDEDWAKVLEVNLTGAFRLTRAHLKSMMKRRFGRVVTITSVVGATGNPGQANYAAAKAGLVGMTKSLALEVASRGITLNCVAPGFIQTPMTDALTEEQKQAIFGRIPLGRMGTPEEIAAPVLFLASREAAYVTGTVLHANGGMAMI